MLPSVHETSWESGAPRAASAAGNRVAETPLELVGSGRQARVRGEFSVPLARDAPACGRRRPEGQAGARPALAADLPSEGDPGAHPGSRRPRLGVLHGPVDDPPRRGGDPQALRCSVPPEPPVASTSGTGLELPETGEAGSGAGRRGHRPLEAAALAAYKKTASSAESVGSLRFGESPKRMVEGDFDGAKG